MIENLPIKIDEVGRIVIPQKVRRKYDIKKGCVLSLILYEKGILLTKQNKETEFNKILAKIHKIEELYNFDIILTDKEKVLYASKKYKDLMEKRVATEVQKKIEEEKESSEINLNKSFSISNPHYYSFIYSNNYTKYLFIIFYKDNELKKIVSLICNLLT